MAASVDTHALGCPLPRVGLQLQLNKTLGACLWRGGGPHECYPDRCASAIKALHLAPTGQLYVPYIVPSENGGRCDVSLLQLWDDSASTSHSLLSEPHEAQAEPEAGAEVGAEAEAKAATEAGAGLQQERQPRAALRISSPRAPFCFSVQPYTTEDLALASHATELEACPRPFFSLNLDAQIMGLGGDDSWTASVHDEFLVPSDQRHHLAFSFSFPSVL